MATKSGRIENVIKQREKERYVITEMGLYMWGYGLMLKEAMELWAKCVCLRAFSSCGRREALWKVKKMEQHEVC